MAVYHKDTNKKDGRYTVAKELSGQPTAVYVARFCDEWLGWAITKKMAWNIAKLHNIKRQKLLVAQVYGYDYQVHGSIDDFLENQEIYIEQ